MELDELAERYIHSWVKNVAEQNYPWEVAMLIKIFDLYNLVGDFNSEYEDLEEGFKKQNFPGMLADEFSMLPGRCPFPPELEDGASEIAPGYKRAYKEHYFNLQDRLLANRELRNKTKGYIVTVGEASANKSLVGAAFMDTFPTLDSVTRHLRQQMYSFNTLMSYSMMLGFPPHIALSNKPFLDKVSDLRIILAQETFSQLYLPEIIESAEKKSGTKLDLP